MKTKTIELYSFEELSEQGKQKAFNNWLQTEYEIGNPWDRENRQTLSKFLDIFPARIKRDGEIQVICNREEITNMTGQRLATYIWNNYRKDLFKGKYYGRLTSTFANGETIPVTKEYPIGQRHVKRYSKIFLEFGNLTGYCMDWNITEPIQKFLQKPDAQTTFEGLLYECYQSWEHAVEKDNDWRLSYEYFVEECEANERTFTENGKLEN